MSAAAAFEAQRPFLRGLAYRMLGSQAEADDVVQDAWLRWQAADAAAVQAPRAFLARTVTRLCLDQMKSARVRREQYFGPWLPEPVTDDEAWRVPGPEAASELASDLSYAFLLALERLSPLERAAFLLHDVFEVDFAEVAMTLQRSPAACRQLASRARDNLRGARPRYAATPAQGERLALAFLAASRDGDLDQLKELLAEDARLISDGGRRVAAIGIPIDGRERIARVFAGMLRKHPLPADTRVEALRINGLPGLLLRAADGTPIQTMAIELDAALRIRGIYVIRNPDKLRRFAAP
ncbi:RNA polymerase sigma factor SigJ [Solimonas flava]|uniref:RNA polymerase sigma factor SigJ n=1 Tax=Solimonas flava TaxID=415849 RepID=UPI0003F609FC|nr:RNA polymerase sigma factor SigJ [Solimonas flava]